MSAQHVHPDEWDQIFYYDGPDDRPVMSVPPRVRATTKTIREVKNAADVDMGIALTDNQAILLADYLVDKMERFGATSARPVFDMEGSGPACSWCSVIWPLCGHQHLSLELETNESKDAA